MKEVKAIYKNNRMVYKYTVTFHNSDMVVRLSDTKNTGYYAVAPNIPCEPLTEEELGTPIDLKTIPKKLKKALKVIIWKKGLKTINLNYKNIDTIVEKFFPSGSGFNYNWEVTFEYDKTFHIQSYYACMDRNGGYDGNQRFTLIIEKKWKNADFSLRFNGPRYMSEKYDLRSYMEDTLYDHFVNIFNT